MQYNRKKTSMSCKCQEMQDISLWYTHQYLYTQTLVMYVYEKETAYNRNWFLNLKWIIMRNYIKS